MPLPETTRRRLEEALLRIYGPARLTTAPEERLVFECDAQTLYCAVPDAVVYPETTREVQETVRLCNDLGVPVLARGAGTGLSGGAVAASQGMILQMSRMNRILSVDYANRVAVIQPGVINLHLSEITRPRGYHFAPDPSSQLACTIGGNVAENSGGPHTLKYGVTTNHVLGLEVVLPTGEILRTGSLTGDAPGFDLTGLFTGTEGTTGIVTEATLRLTPNIQAVRTFLAVYDTVDDASETVSGVIREGIIPAAIELIDNLAIQAVEAHMKPGFPPDAAAVLLIEIDGIETELDAMAGAILAVCRANHCRDVQQARDEETRTKLWKGRKNALGALGKICKAYYTHDGVVPRSKLPEALRRIAEVAARNRLRIGNVCHAGDGSLHPVVLYDPKDAEELERAHRAGGELLKACLSLGGTLSGEHGIGLEKRDCMPWLFTPDDLDQFDRVRRAFDPKNLCNPGKKFPVPGASHA